MSLETRHFYKSKREGHSGRFRLKPITLLLAQSAPKLGRKEENLKTIEKQAISARRKDINLLIFPELHLTGYSMQDMVNELAETIPGPSEKRIEKIAKEHGVHIILGMPEESEVKGVIHNTALIVGPKGLVGKYRKIHL
ncbi:carbon-nitrogen hydrolase family protein, partial [Candidatus Bathyarchaeota archaeon]|nr:carbon-nitrogen hydrolase family protein [Candidatus Bathyarchaeota archaeon]